MGSAKKFIKDPKRMLTAAVTGGLSEAVRAGGKLLKSGGGTTAAGINREPFDIEAEANSLSKRIDPMLQQQMTRQGQTSTAFDSANIAKNLALSASGQGPSLAQAQMKASQDRNLSQLMAAQSAARGGSGAAGARNLALASTQGNRQVAQDSGSARILEQRQAQQDLIGLRSGEDSAAGDLIQDKFNADTAAKREMQQAEIQQFGANQQMAIAKRQGKDARTNALIGAAGSAGSALLMPGKFMSDENVKKDVKTEGAKVDKFLEKLKSVSYEYKNNEMPGTSPGKKIGVLAQDLEKSEIGANMVQETENGKAVSIPDSFSAILASQARLAERLSAIEKKKGSKA